MFNLNPGASLGVIIFTVLIRESEKQRKVLRDCLKNLPTEIPAGQQTVPRYCATRESLMTREFPRANFSRKPQGLSLCLYQVMVILSASVEIFSVSRMRDFQRIGPWADSFIQLECQFIYLFVPFSCNFF